ncbi:adenosylcobinamide-GDP ribazoletransferase [Parendozoicomonas haliclonae]|uniref:Adenosylcobinamide-GDP ribazoletransferase n=1 Tax=Parendozoicomonas haliclonae TaxID=1960125 RepID=A0A1X7AM33_9GAMM|nr:adenosylcobinamide-GDP ribazoletransferase [Parendozoicomonas haliclonae]SMA48854.1 Cobalamin synthase [Parendozoicomonas haliclonae]
MDEQSPSSTVSTRERHSRAIALALGFFSRLPTRHLETIEDEDMGRAVVYMPVVGLIIGLILVVTGLVLSSFLGSWHGDLNTIHLSLIGLTLFAILTLASGGLHLDGLGDCADAWVGGLGDKERTLLIMKDPTCGPMAVMVVVLGMLVKAGGMVALTISQSWLAILLIPVLSRTAGMGLFLNTPYVRPKGLGQAFSDFAANPVTRSECRSSLMAALAISAVLLAGVWPALILVLLLWYWLRQQTLSRLEGFTGDVCGAVIEITEACLFLFIALLV